MASPDGALAVGLAIVLFGSFGVPIKSVRVLQAQAHPLVYQLYKSLACLGVSSAVLLFKSFSWSWWSLLQASMWVATGTLAIFAIQRAGLGLSQTIYSSLTVFISYFWGVAAFHETGRSAGLALLGLVLIVAGLAGLGHAASSAPRATLQRVPSAESTTFLQSSGSHELPPQVQLAAGWPAAAPDGAGGGGREGGQCDLGSVAEADSDPPPQPAGELNNGSGGSGKGGGAAANGQHHVRIGAQLHHRSVSSSDLRGGGDPSEDKAQGGSPASSTCKDLEAARRRVLRLLGPPGELRIILRQNWLALRVRLRAAWASSRGRGVMAAAVVGLLNGSFLVPFKLARRNDEVQGIDYVVPFSISSLLVSLLVCAVYSLTKSHPPQLHVQAVAAPALLTGVLWSLGNICSIWAVQRLGLSVGYPLVQCQLVVSTAWAVLYYKEVPGGAGGRTLLAFVAFTLLVVAGMVLLAVYGSS